VRKILIVMTAFGLLLAGCSKKDKSAPESMQEGVFAGEVLETFDVDSYTYARINTVNGEFWLAGPTTGVAVGDNVYYTNPMEMKDFHSQSLDRTFSSILFVNRFYLDEQSASGMPAVPGDHPAMEGNAKQNMSTERSAVSIDKPEGGHSIAELYAGSAELSGSTVKIQGKVVKFSANIMGKNWLHLQDGTEHQGNYDLTVTSGNTYSVGDVIIVEGTLKTDQDFGFGYKYPLLLEEKESM